MINNNLFSSQIIPAKLGSLIKDVLIYMQENQINHLPVISQGSYLGLINADILKEEKSDFIITEKNIFLSTVASPGALFIHLWAKIIRLDLSCLPIVDSNRTYIGCVTKPDLIKYYSQNFSTLEPGSIVVISMRRLDYSLVLLSQIVEEHNGIILSNFISEISEDNTVLVTLKLNQVDPQAILNHFYRHEIEIKNVFSEGEYTDIFKDRYDEFMHFLYV